MTRFFPVYVRRSDGKASMAAARGRREEPNQPTAEQMDQKADANGVSDYYREVLSDEAKNIDWRRKLGGMLARELGWTSADAGHILVEFPEHYRLFEHIKKSDKDGSVKNKTHAAGGNDRQDAYLYGHPDGRRKRFRSPADFFPHLLWLCTDESGDPDNCSCKLCCPEEFDITPAVKVTKKAESVPAQKPQSQLTPTPLPKMRHPDQEIDSRYRSFGYRTGELCWFKRESAWALGVILRRWIDQSQHNYVMQPLSHPYQHLPSVITSSDSDMRPWLAWSVPKYTHPGLNDLPEPPRYDTVDWQAILRHQYGAGNLEVDGSILAAKSIDLSYTPFDPIPGSNGQYNCIYIGGEKVWLGEAIRVTTDNSTDICVLHSISEVNGALRLVGDVYASTEVQHTDPTRPSLASAAYNPQLPSRLIADLEVRNAASITTRNIATYWKLIAIKQELSLNSIKGRWYEASIFLPVLQPEAYTTMVKQGKIEELSLYMNSRGDCLGANRDERLSKPQKVNVRRSTRLEAIGNSIPRDAQLVEGIEPPAGDDMMLDPQFAVGQGDDGGAMDQFVNLDAASQGYQGQRY